MQSYRSTWRAAIGAALLSLTPTAHAATINVTQIVDLNAPGIIQTGSGNQTINHIFTNTHAVAEGDIVNLTFDFLGSQTLTIHDLSGTNFFESIRPWFRAYYNGGFTIDNISIMLDTTPISPISDPYSSGAVHLGPDAQQFLAAGTSITMSQISTSYHITDLPTTPVNVDPWLLIQGERLTVGNASVPDAGNTASLVALSLVGLAAFWRRRTPD